MLRWTPWIGIFRGYDMDTSRTLGGGVIDLDDIPVVDNHVHPWRAATQHISVDELAGHVAFSDGVIASVRREFLPLDQLAPTLRLFRQTNLGANLLRGELARLLEVDDDWE